MTEQVHVFNTLGREKQALVPRQAGKISMYTCGPTVYKYNHIGNFRSYLLADFWVRALEYLGFEVTQVQNITDVGHLIGDDDDTGEDKVLAAAREEGKDPDQIAEFYTEAFIADRDLLRIRPPDHQPRATQFIDQMIALIQRLEAAGLTYEKNGNVFFDVTRLDHYPRLSGNTLDQLQGGQHRVAADPNKRHPADFLLWKAGEERRLQIWDSPWGRGFPGWHIECSAMSLHFFPAGFDIHTGGVDNIFPHHEDEMAQSDAVLGSDAVRYWIHGDFLLIDGAKMAKSAGSVIRITDLSAMGFDPLAYRFLCMTARYRVKLSFSQEIIESAQRGLMGVRARASRLPPAEAADSDLALQFEARFRAALADDLDLPLVGSLLQEVLRSAVSEGQKRALLEAWDAVLQLDLTRAPAQAAEEAPAEAVDLARRRDQARTARDWAEADTLRAQLEEMGWAVEDSPEGTRLRPR
ncbi:MAG: cysteine--tRNA ligase [Candidatus Dormibacteria bacterium]